MEEDKKYTIVVKIGSSSLVDVSTKEPRIANMSLIVETIVKLRRQGHKIIIVSSGAIAFGMKKTGLKTKPTKLSAIQALASIGQGSLIGLFDDLFGQLDQPIAQILITRNDISDFTQYRNATNTLSELLDMGVIPIVNENDTLSVAEIKFGDNDTLSAITAGMIHADYLFLMTDVECLYTDNPRANPNAKPVLLVDKVENLSVETGTEANAGTSVGTGGMTTKLIAAELATNAGVDTIISLSSKPGYISNIFEHIQNSNNKNLSIEEQEQQIKEDIAAKKIPLHTRFLGLDRESKIKSDRRFWLLHGLKTKGVLYIDQGCFEALTRKDRAGLLPAGIVDVEGNFHESECVSIKVIPTKTSPLTEGLEVGRCRVNYSSAEIKLIRGVKSSEIESKLGFADSEYIAHRDNLAFPPLVSSGF
ncbi:Piso0_005761 [Millerozyma farinosa CBS 7064]|uniref:Piso0_005761 protein n=1 Tax=Pichia sorbitophila (strain ATCC MYA-4447 / BCRC 22081 / CBS 7064 / NBRC 10061 / NRRL Y-12695) TaxID=559304 RepID=G8XZV9_PICSO|nr:Piso0_005761 [Millerozyma farinosa CBS 7064]